MLIVVFLAIFSVYKYKKANIIKKIKHDENYEKTIATTKVIRMSNNQEQAVYYPVISYIDKKGTEHLYTFKRKFKNEPSEFKTYEVYYRIDNPKDCVVPEDQLIISL